MSEHFSIVPHIVLMMQVYFVLALQTAEVERGFSFHKMIKSRFRSQLTIMATDSLMRGKLLAKPFDWDHR